MNDRLMDDRFFICQLNSSIMEINNGALVFQKAASQDYFETQIFNDIHATRMTSSFNFQGKGNLSKNRQTVSADCVNWGTELVDVFSDGNLGIV